MKIAHVDDEGNLLEITCNSCRRTYPNADDLSEHLIKNGGVCATKCHYCDEKFNNVFERKTHIEKVHRDENGDLPPLKCEDKDCKKTFKTHAKMRQHFNGVHYGLVECRICVKTFTKKGIKEHNKVVHVDKNDKKFKCNSCEYATYAYKFLHRHTRMKHEKNHKNVCQHCGTTAPYEHMLKTHKCKADMQCLVCKKDFKQSRSLMNHYQADHNGVPEEYEGRVKFHCHPCKETGLSLEEMKKHIDAKHNNTEKDEATTSEKAPLCSECNQDFSNEGYLLQHYKIVHKGIPPGMKNRKQFICEQCGEIYLSQLTLQNHTKRVHSQCEECGCECDCGCRPKLPPKKKVNCSHCEKTFVSYARCKEHIRSKHEKNTPFQCDQCHRSYGTAVSLRTHKTNMHHRVKCDQCDQEICNAFILTRHKASVHGVTPPDSYRCEHCPAFFRIKKNKEKHIAKQHLQDLQK